MAITIEQNPAPPSVEFQEDLMERFDHQVKRSRMVAIERAIATMFPLELLLEWAHDPRWRVRESVAIVLGRYPIAKAAQETAIVEVLQIMLQSEHWRVVVAVAEALGARMSEASLPQLKARFEQSSHTYTHSGMAKAIGQAVAGIAIHSKSLQTLTYAASFLRYRDREKRQQCLSNILDICSQDPSEFDRLFLSLNITRGARERLAQHTPKPLPAWLNVNEERRLLPQLEQLSLAGMLSSSEVAELLYLRIVNDGCGPMQFYEFLCSIREITTYEFNQFNRDLEMYTAEITAHLQSWMPRLGDLQKKAIQWLGMQGPYATSALPLLIEMTNVGDTTTQNRARNAIYCILQPHGGRNQSNDDHNQPSARQSSSQTELISSLRAFLHLPWDKGSWRLLKALLEHSQNHEDIEMAIDYIDMHLPAEARRQTAQNNSWLQTLQDPEPTPFLRLLRRINLGLLLREHKELSSRQILEKKYFNRINHLDIQDTIINEAFVDALQGVQAPQTITHIYLNNAYLNAQMAARLLQTLGLPQLTHLYLSNNPLGEQHIDELTSCPVLAHVTHLNLKNSLTPKAANQMAGSPKLKNLQKLNLSHNKLTTEDIILWLDNNTIAPGGQIDARHNLIKEIEVRHELIALAEKREITLYL